MLACDTPREIIMLLMQKNSNEFWAVPPIVPYHSVEPSCELKGFPALSTRQRPFFVA
jgi:hypothetical protein